MKTVQVLHLLRWFTHTHSALTHNLITRNFAHTTLSHTSLSQNLFHTQLRHTQLCRTYSHITLPHTLSHTHSHKTLSRNLSHTIPSRIATLFHTPLFHTTLSHATLESYRTSAISFVIPALSIFLQPLFLVIWLLEEVDLWGSRSFYEQVTPMGCGRPPGKGDKT